MSAIHNLRMGIACGALLALSMAAASAQLVNGGFEAGDFTGFTGSAFLDASPPGSIIPVAPTYASFLAGQTGGVAQIDSNGVETSQTSGFGLTVGATPAVGPTEGSFLAFVTNQNTGGNNSLTGSSISQTFTVPLNSPSLSLDVQLLNDDFPASYADFNDFGGVALLNGSTLLGEYDIALDPTSGANAFVNTGNDAGGFRNSSGWLTPTFSLVGLGGDSLTLTAFVSNYGDNNGESRLLVDNIGVADAATPEPGSLALVGAFCLSAASAIRRRRKV